jgi:hypothetical protein
VVETGVVAELRDHVVGVGGTSGHPMHGGKLTAAERAVISRRMRRYWARRWAQVNRRVKKDEYSCL